MATDVRETEPIPTLRDGDRMTRQEFHAVYERMPAHVRAQLIGGIVHMASPMKLDHGTNTAPFTALFYLYLAATPGVQLAEGATVLLSEEDEPEPDVILRILPDHGGRSRTTPGNYIEGPPELLVEVSDATRAADLGKKRRQYAKYGVLEYVVADLRDNRLHWFDLAADRELTPDTDGIYRIRTFPGLWIDSSALLAPDPAALLATLHRGLATPEHAAFVAKLAAAKTA